MGDHDKALGIFVSKIKDLKAAEDYCDKMADEEDKEKNGLRNNKARKMRQKLLLQVLKIYLDPNLE